MREIAIYRMTGETSNLSTPLHLVVNEAALIDLVEQAAQIVIRFTDPISDDYVQPAVWMNDGFEPYVGKIAPKFNPGHRTPNGQRVYIQMMRQAELLTKFAEMVNADTRYYVGEEWWTRSSVYLALAYLHNWKVHCVDKSIELNGPNFGSATGWHTTNVAAPVKDWFTKFKWDFEVPILKLPCERADWQEVLDKDRKKRQAEAQAKGDTA